MGWMMATEDELSLPIVEETLVVGKRSTVTGRVRVSTKTEMVETLAGLDLDTETVEVSHVPVNREVDAAPPVRTEGDVTIIPVMEEVLIVEKRLMLKEEIHIRRGVSQEHVEVPVTLRKQSAVVERLDHDENR
jgi:stress response protein YsnF